VSDLDLDWVSRVARLETIEEIKQLQVAPPDARDPGWIAGMKRDGSWARMTTAKCDNGVWLFEVMNLHVNLFAPHQGSWADTAVQ
jgi:hypothetical protein